MYVFIFWTILPILLAENLNLYFTQSIYEIWCQENVHSNSLFLYPNRIPGGIHRRSNIKSVVYQLIDHHDLFDVQTKPIGDFDFFLLNITRPLDINREYQDIYRFFIQANISTHQGNLTEQAEIHLHVADSNDNDGVFDLDVYEKILPESFETSQSLLRFHASDADEIHHAQILYELSFDELFSLHPFTGELYFLSKTNLQASYEFDIYAYDRHRISNNNIKTKAHVILRFPGNRTIHRLRTIWNQTIEFEELISSYDISFFQSSNWNLLNIHQPILILKISSILSSFEIFLLDNSSINSRNLFLNENKIYLNQDLFQEYNLQFLICLFNRTKCQLINYDLVPSIDFHRYRFHFQSIQSLSLEENLPIQSFLTTIQLGYHHIHSNEQLIIHYRLLNHQQQFHLHFESGILRLARSLEYQNYSLEIQADIYLLNQFSSIKTTLQIHVREINKYRPIFSKKISTELVQLPYQFHAIDFDRNNQTNGRITYRLWNCFHHCPFQINPNSGLLSIRRDEAFLPKKIYNIQIIAFDWGEPISFETQLNVTIDFTYDRDGFVTINSDSLIPTEETIDLNIGFKQKSAFYYLSEDAQVNTIIDYFNLEYDTFPFFINPEKENLFFYVMNETSFPFTIDQNQRAIQLINHLDREKQDQYTFEIELKLKSSYEIKFQENQSLNIRYSNKFNRKMLITIYIDDVNDHIPRCHSFHQQIFLNEKQIQTNIFQVQAFDLDRGENGTIIYSLLDYQDYFTINSYTGQINVIQSIDHEQISSLLLHIIASDRGEQPQLQALCMTLHITIVDVNDHIPQFSLANYTFHVYSDLPRGTIFGQIYALDADSTDQLIYSLDFNSYITINQHTGHLRLKSSLDHLSNQNLNLTVRVSDSLHTNQTWMFIHLKHFPAAQEPILLSEPAYSITINQSTSIETIVTNIYQDLGLLESSIDFIEIIPKENRAPFSIDQQGSLRLTDSLIDLANSSYWLSIRLTRYRAHPPHSFVHIHLAILEDNFHFPQCLNIYQEIKLYDYSIPYPLARIQALSFYNHLSLKYSLLNDKFFSIDKQTGFIQLSSSIQIHQLIQSNYFLTIQAFDHEHNLSVDCFLNIHHIQRQRLVPKFYYSSIYQIDLIEVSVNNERLRQRLFQVIALLDHQIYNQNLQIRYRILDSQSYFLINRQTGYIAAKKSLKSSTIYRLNIEAYSIAYVGKWRVVSPRVILAIKIRILPLSIHNSSLIIPKESIINIDLLTTTKVGSKLHQLEVNPNHTTWFIMTNQIEYTRYFHVNFQSGELILVRPIEELINQTTMIKLYINTTNDWIHMNIIRIIIHIKNDQSQYLHFSQTDYYTSISKTIPIGIEIARLTIANPHANCTYHIHSIERIRSREFFHMNPYSGSITILQSLKNSRYEKHLLNIIYQCSSTFQIASTRLHINILEKKNLEKNSVRFSQDNYLIIFETSLIKQQKKYLMNFEFIHNNQEKRMPADAQIIQGDPLGLFSIDSSNQSLVLLDESLSRSYIYPIRLIIIDTSQKEIINCTVTIFISNIAIRFTCPPRNPSPYLFTYESFPSNTLDLFTGQQYNPYNSLIIHGFDSLTPLNLAECFLFNSTQKFSSENLDFTFEKGLYQYTSNDQLIHLSIQNRADYSEPFDITYHLLSQNSFQIDEYTGLIKSNPKSNLLPKYSLLILAKYHSLLAFTRVNILVNQPKESIYRFQLFKPFVDNYTIGYVNKRFSNRKISSIFSIDHTGRLFLTNATLILPSRNFYDLLIEKSHIEIQIFSKEILQCSLNQFHLSDNDQFIGFIEIFNHSRSRSFYLLNYNHLFLLNHEHGLLYHQNKNQNIEKDYRLLIEIENARCFITVHRVNSEIKKQSSGTLINFDVVSPILSRRSYTFSLNLTDNFNRTIFVGQISAEPYSINRSCLVYEFLSSTEYYIIHPENGIIEYIPNRYYNKTIEQLQIIARDLIYQENTTIDLTIHIIKSEYLSLSSLIYHRTISEILPLGSIIFEPNISTIQILSYSLQDSYSNLFTIDTYTGQIILLASLSESFYSLKIHLSPINQIIILQLTILDVNNHAPIFSNLPFNLTISSTDTFVTKISAYDLDLSDNENLKYYLLDSNQRKIFSINQTTGIIIFQTHLFLNQTSLQLKIAVTDGLHLTIDYLPITIYNYSKTSPKFSSHEYSFQYNKQLGQIFAYDPDPNDQLIYQLYLEPNGIHIDPYSGFITIDTNLFFQIIEFFASASDRAQQIVYTKIKILFPIQPKFSSYLYYLSLPPSLTIPSEIFHLQLVDSFNQPLSSTRFEIDPTNLFEVKGNKLILKEKVSQSKIFYFNIYAYWRNYTCQTSIQILFVDRIIRLKQKFYEFSIEKTQLKDDYFIHQFDIENSLLKILSTPLTITECLRNFYLKSNQLYFHNSPIVSDLCFFEIQLSNEKSIYSSLIKISFIDPDFPPIFSAKIYSFSTNYLQVFAKSSNKIRYKLQTNPYGLIIDQITGLLSFKSHSNLDQIQLLVYAIDDKTNLNDTAVIRIPARSKNAFEIPPDIPSCSNTPSIAFSDRNFPGTIVQDIHQANNNSNQYSILSGDTYNLFAINHIGKIYLASSVLNRTSEEFFQLIIVIASSSSISYCRTKIIIIRIPQWSHFICPPIPLEWIVEEESPIGTRIGNVKEILLLINNNSQLINRIRMKSNHTEAFHFSSSTGLIHSNSRLDYEQRSFYSFSIALEPSELNCSLAIRIHLINTHDQPIIFDQNSLNYTIYENHLIPFYIGRVHLIDSFYSSQYHYFLTNSSSNISIDPTTGSIISLTKLHRDQLQYEIIAIDSLNGKNITDILRINIRDQIQLRSSVIIDNSIYFNFNTIHQCFIDKNQESRTKICTIGKNSTDFIYQLIDPMNLFDILSNNGTIINREIFNSKINQPEFHVTIVVRDQKDQSIVLSSLNLTIHLRNLNDQPENSTTLLYLFYPSINTIVYTIEGIDNDQSNLTYETVNDTFSSYTLRLSSNSTELILIKAILSNREDNLIIHVGNSEIKLHLIFLQYEIQRPTILSQTIDGYLNLSSNINLGQLFIQNHSEYQFIYFDLIPNKHFSLRQLSNNRTELYFNPSNQSTSFLEFQINFTIIALTEPIPEIDFSKNTKVFFPLITKSQSIDIHLWSINREMLDRTVSILIDLNTTYEQFLIHNLPIIRQTLARMIPADIHHVHIYTFDIRQNQIELLFAVLRSTSSRYLHKKFLRNALKNVTNMYDYCQLNPCENNAYCTSHVNLLDHQYIYFYSNTYQRLIPKYHWNRTCLCEHSYYGDHCQFQQEIYSPCSSNPCSSKEKCLEKSPTSYSCQCIDAVCDTKTSLNCININSPACRNSSNILTFDGDSFIRMNATIQTTEYLNITFSFRTQSTEGKLLQLISSNEKRTLNHSIIIQIIDGLIKLESNEIRINDGLWHDIDFSIDSSSSYLLRLDHVFSEKIILSSQTQSTNLLQLIIGSNYHGCLGNFSLNNQMIPLQEQNDNNNNNNSVEFIGTINYGCQLPEIITDNLCSSYNPCYHGGICINHEDFSFICNCTNPRFTGRQCQLDLYPCQSHPCRLYEQCIPFSYDSNRPFRCIHLSISTKKFIYIGLVLSMSLCFCIILFIYYYKKRREDFLQDAPFVSAPLLIHQPTESIDGTMQTLLKSNSLKKQVISKKFSNESLNHHLNDSKYYSTIEQMNTHVHYSSIDYDIRDIYVNSLSNLTDNFPVENDIDLTESSNDSSIINPHSFLFHDNQMPTSTVSLPKGPIYASVVKTARVRQMLNSTPTSLIEPNELTTNRLRHASDSDLLNGRKSNKLSSFFQTDV